jgi:hypothetical protein
MNQSLALERSTTLTLLLTHKIFECHEPLCPDDSSNLNQMTDDSTEFFRHRIASAGGIYTMQLAAGCLHTNTGTSQPAPTTSALSPTGPHSAQRQRDKNTGPQQVSIRGWLDQLSEAGLVIRVRVVGSVVHQVDS